MSAWKYGELLEGEATIAARLDSFVEFHREEVEEDGIGDRQVVVRSGEGDDVVLMVMFVIVLTGV